MDFRGREVDFQEADRRYEELKRQLDGGSISEEEFDEQLQRLMVQDESGRWWVKSRKGGEWHYHDGKSWVRGTPPGYSHPTSATLDQNTGEQGRREVRSIVGVLVWLAILVVALGGGAGVAAIFLAASTETPSSKSKSTSSEKASSENTSSEKVEKISSESTSGTRTGGSSENASCESANLVADLEGPAPPIGEASRIMDEVEGKTIGEAARIVGGDYKLQLQGVEQSPNPKGTIISTSGLTSNRPDTITLTLSGGEQSVTVPDVSGLCALHAGKVLLDAGLHPLVHVYFDQSGNAVTATSIEEEKDVSTTKISGTHEEAGSVVPAGTAILLKTTEGPIS
jgi:beta-lactam-binding protein with PASTA domain